MEKMLLQVLSALWCVVMTAAETSHSVPVSILHHGQICHEHVCKQPVTLAVTQYAVVTASSPLYMSVLPLSDKTIHIDNVCYSYFETGGTTLLTYISIVFKNGTSEQWSYIKDDVPGRMGVIAGGNPTCMTEEFAFQQTCENSFALYRCFLIGSCTQFDAALTPGVDVLFTISLEPKISKSCQEEQVALLSSAGFSDRGYVKLPQKLPYQCVTSLNGAKSINADKTPGNPISKP